MLSGGTAICGGTAIATLAPIIQAKPQHVGVAMALVFLFNAVALLTFPYIGHALDLSQQDFGAWVALAIHDTSSVVATAAIYGDEAAVVATTVKLGRTLWLIPLAFAVGLIYRSSEARLRVPGFILLFIAAAVLGSFIPMNDALLGGISVLSKALLVVALGMIGLEIDRATQPNILAQYRLGHGFVDLGSAGRPVTGAVAIVKGFGLCPVAPFMVCDTRVTQHNIYNDSVF